MLVSFDITILPTLMRSIIIHLIKPFYNILLHYHYIPMILENNIIMKRVSISGPAIEYNLVNKVYKHLNMYYIYFFIH